MKAKNIMTAALAVSVGVVAAAPTVSSVTVAQDAQSRLVKVGYSLSAEAIVTIEAFTNGVSIGGEPLHTANGDVWRKVTAGDAKEITWQPRSTFQHGVIDDGSFSVKVTAWALDNPPDYLVADLTVPSNLWWYASADQVPNGIGHDLYMTGALVMRRIHATGVMWPMGSRDGEYESYAATEEIPHPVILTNDYYMAIYKMTHRQHYRILGQSSAYSMLPMQQVKYVTVRGAEPTYDWPTTGHAVDPTSVCGKLRTLTGIDTFDLPTEAQWEFACRGGTSARHIGFSTIGEVAWCHDSSVDWTKPGATGSESVQKVGLLKPNGYGLYDILGNGFEWCLDYRATGDAYAKKGVLQYEPVGPTSTESGNRVIRSGSWDHDVFYTRASQRHDKGATSTSGVTEYVTYRLVCGCDFR